MARWLLGLHGNPGLTLQFLCTEQAKEASPSSSPLGLCTAQMFQLRGSGFELSRRGLLAAEPLGNLLKGLALGLRHSEVGEQGEAQEQAGEDDKHVWATQLLGRQRGRMERALSCVGLTKSNPTFSRMFKKCER